MRNARLWRRLLGAEKTVVEDVDFDGEESVLVARVRPTGSMRGRCGQCLRRCPGYGRGEGRRRWRTLDAGTIRVELEADAPKVLCKTHGVIAAAVPWARHQAGHSHFFDAHVAWLATQTSKTAITQLMRIARRTVGAIITRVWADTEKQYDQFAGLTRIGIGIDEISYKRGHKYLTCVVDHDSGRLVWAAPGQDKATLARFFDALGPERSAQITHVSADGAAWITSVVKEKAPNAIRCADRSTSSSGPPTPSTRCGDQHGTMPGKLPGKTMPAAPAADPRLTPRPGPDSARAAGIKNCRYALWKNPGNLTEKQTVKLAWIVQTDPTLGRAYYLKEGLRTVFKLPYDQAAEALDRRSPRQTGRLGPPVPDPRVREIAEKHHQAPHCDLRLDRTRPLQRTGRIDEYQDPTHHPHRLRLHIPRRPDRPRHAQPRRPQTDAPRPNLTHG